MCHLAQEQITWKLMENSKTLGGISRGGKGELGYKLRKNFHGRGMDLFWSNTLLRERGLAIHIFLSNHLVFGIVK